MKYLLVFYLIANLVFIQTTEAQRGTQRNQSSAISQFHPVSQSKLEKTINKLGIELGLTLDQAKKLIEKDGGEVVWLGSPDPNFTRTKKELQRGISSYFRYAAHSTKGKQKSTTSLQTKPYSNEDIVIFIDVYPISKEDFKDPNNLIIQRLETAVTFQPTYHQMTRFNIKPVQISYNDFNEIMEKQGHSLLQVGPSLVYKKGGISIDAGDMTASRSTWKNNTSKQSPCSKLSSMSNKFAETTADMLSGMKESGPDGYAVINYEPMSVYVDKYQGEGTFEGLKDCGSVTVLEITQIANPENIDKPLLNMVSFNYQSADILADAFESFYNTLYID
ncbi:hypothetical protein CLV90_0517 [Maribacter spongiicola]|uniref:Uncharacterized protein n=1 Tax=Maribacter spongiicola TaxID=1206753 RepID=A0A4R7K5I1_9FLAO|nr:hypothetical protein [Maribacter spongiicola]TDT46466.1 hypothetical protein CLV90_0517 [Maribacter spongiicola]